MILSVVYLLGHVPLTLSSSWVSGAGLIGCLSGCDKKRTVKSRLLEKVSGVACLIIPLDSGAPGVARSRWREIRIFGLCRGEKMFG